MSTSRRRRPTLSLAVSTSELSAGLRRASGLISRFRAQTQAELSTAGAASSGGFVRGFLGGVIGGGLIGVGTALASQFFAEFEDPEGRLAPIGQAFENVKEELFGIVAELAPAVLPLINDLLIPALRLVGDFLRDNRPLVERFTEVVSRVLGRVASTLLPVIGDLLETVVVPLMETFLEIFEDNEDVVIGALEAIATLMSGIGNVLRLITPLVTGFARAFYNGLRIVQPLIELILDGISAIGRFLGGDDARNAADLTATASASAPVEGSIINSATLPNSRAASAPVEGSIINSATLPNSRAASAPVEGSIVNSATLPNSRAASASIVVAAAEPQPAVAAIPTVAQPAAAPAPGTTVIIQNPNIFTDSLDAQSFVRKVNDDNKRRGLD